MQHQGANSANRKVETQCLAGFSWLIDRLIWKMLNLDLSSFMPEEKLKREMIIYSKEQWGGGKISFTLTLQRVMCRCLIADQTSVRIHSFSDGSFSACETLQTG